MPRERRASQAPVIPTRSLVASSTRYAGRVPRIFIAHEEWQHEAYRHYAICGEARFAARFFGHAVSRAVLSVAKPGVDNKAERADDSAQAVLNELFAGKEGQREMLEACGVHLAIAGECYLVGRTVDRGLPTEYDLWEIVSIVEMRVTGDSWTVDYQDGSPPVSLGEEDVVIRIWTPDPKQKVRADSPFKSVLPVLREIEYLTRHVFAQVTSRLAGAGILFVSQDMTFDAPPEQGADGSGDGDQPGDLDPFLRVLADAMMAPINDPDSPAALVPIVVKVPDAVVDKANLMHFWTDLDENAQSLRGEAIKRFALGMDLPPEQILGMSSHGGSGGGASTGVSHWGAWQIEESTIKLHVEPMLDVIVNALTMGYLRPLLNDGRGAVEFVDYDTSALRLRPDRSKEAMELYDRGVLNAPALLRETGFADSDAMSETEFRRWLLVKVASGSATPEQVGAAIAALGVVLNVPAVPAIEQDPTNEARPTPSLEDHPSRDLPDAAALLAASDALVYRALERAGNRLRQSGQRPPNVPSFETHCHVKANGSVNTILHDAFPAADRVFAGIADCDVIVPHLDAYCRNLIAEGAPHDRDRLRTWLSMAGVL